MEDNSRKSGVRASIEIIRRISSRIITAEEIQDLLAQYPSDKRLISVLLTKPEFPQHNVMSVLSKMYSVELLKIAQAPRTAPFVRQKAEILLIERFRQMQRGEQISALKIMGPGLLKQFVQTTDIQLVSAILGNPRCTEEVVMEMLRRKGTGTAVYQALMQSRWITNLSVADHLAADPQTPIRCMLAVIPLLPMGTLRKISGSSRMHGNVREAVEKRLKRR